MLASKKCFCSQTLVPWTEDMMIADMTVNRRCKRFKTQRQATFGKGQMGSALMGSLQISMWFDRGTFWVLPLTYFCLPKGARTYLFPQSVEINDFRSGPVSVDPICPQPKAHRRPDRPREASPPDGKSRECLGRHRKGTRGIGNPD